jgi:hypothetical protein
MPAPAGNRNAYRHGLRSTATPEAGVDGQVRALKREIRQQLAGADGRLTLAQEALLQSLARHEIRALLAGVYLRKEKTLTVDQRLNLLATVTSATAERDKILRQLGIDLASDKPGSSSDLWANFDAERLAGTPESPPNASGATNPTETPSPAAPAFPDASEKLTPAITPLGEPFPQPNEGNALLQPATEPA